MSIMMAGSTRTSLTFSLALTAMLAACAHAHTPTAVARGAGVSSNQRQQWLEMFARGYFPGRSGQVFYVPHEGDFLIDKDPLYTFMHGSPWDYDARSPLVC